jgi:hypothetical protein
VQQYKHNKWNIFFVHYYHYDQNKKWSLRALLGSFSSGFWEIRNYKKKKAKLTWKVDSSSLEWGRSLILSHPTIKYFQHKAIYCLVTLTKPNFNFNPLIYKL